MVKKFDPLELTEALVKCPSVTPLEGGALDYLVSVFEGAGYSCQRMPFNEDGTADIDNLYARIGTSQPHLAFAGHTDVVPVGDEAAWTSPPFEPTIRDDVLYGRGVADMKGGIACFLAAALEYAADNGGSIPGSISFIITGDEEGPAINGTRKMLELIKEQDEKIDHCIVGEPSNPNALGDMIKIGRRGSLTAELKISGVQGHVAYPDLSANPVPCMVNILHGLTSRTLDQGTAHFDPSNLEVTSVDVGNPASNVIPAEIAARLNIRFNDEHDAASLRTWIETIVESELEDTELKSEIQYQPSSDCFITEPGEMVDVLRAAIKSVTGNEPELSTSGGTSDARFIKDICPVVEFGLINKSIHQVDENAAVDDLYRLKEIYLQFIKDYFEAFGKIRNT